MNVPKSRKRRAKTKGKGVVRNSVLERRRLRQVESLNLLLNNMQVEQKLVRAIKNIYKRIDNPSYRTWTKAVVMYDNLFLAAEPNAKKRRAILTRIFKLRPRASDHQWVSMIYKYQTSEMRTSLRYSIKNKIINNEV